MSASQRLTLIAVPILVFSGFMLLMWQTRDSGYTPLSFGKIFTTEELRSAEQAVRDAGLTDYQVQGQRILVPTDSVERYNAALLEGGALPTNWAEEWDQKFSEANLFTSERQLSTMREIALAKELRRVLKAVPAIADASVVWARSQNTRRWSRTAQRVTATVVVRPRAGRELSPELIQSLRAAVSRMVPDLKNEDVTIFDQATGIAHEPNSERDLDHQIVGWIKQHTRVYQEKIASHLSYIPGVLVSVNVDIDSVRRRVDRLQEIDSKKTVSIQQSQSSRNLTQNRQPVRAEPGQNSNTPRSLTRAAGDSSSETLEETDQSSVVAPSYRVTEQEFLPAMPTSVQASIAIPEEYYAAVAVQQGLTRGETDAEKQAFQAEVTRLKAEIQAAIAAQVQRLLPKGTATDSVDITSFTAVDPEPIDFDQGFVQQAKSVASEYGSMFALAGIALLSLWLLYRSIPTDQTEAENLPELKLPSIKAPAEETEDGPKPETTQDRVRRLARDNPDVTADVLSRWLDPDS